MVAVWTSRLLHEARSRCDALNNTLLPKTPIINRQLQKFFNLVFRRKNFSWQQFIAFRLSNVHFISQFLILKVLQSAIAGLFIVFSVNFFITYSQYRTSSFLRISLTVFKYYWKFFSQTNCGCSSWMNRIQSFNNVHRISYFFIVPNLNIKNLNAGLRWSWCQT